MSVNVLMSAISEKVGFGCSTWRRFALAALLLSSSLNASPAHAGFLDRLQEGYADFKETVVEGNAGELEADASSENVEGQEGEETLGEKLKEFQKRLEAFAEKQAARAENPTVETNSATINTPAVDTATKSQGEESGSLVNARSSQTITSSIDDPEETFLEFHTPGLAQTADGAVSLNDAALPARWEYHKAREPVFSSQLHFVEAGKQNTKTIVLIHGLGQVGFRDWLNVIPELENNFHVLALDLPGFGASEHPAGRYSPTNYAKIVSWLVTNYAKRDSTPETDTADSTEALGNVIVVGHSMGGAVALRYASDYSDQVEKLILVDAAGILERTAFLKHQAATPVAKGAMPDKIKRISAKIKDFTGSLVEMATVGPDLSVVLDASDIIWNRTFKDKSNMNAALALIKEDFSLAIKTLPIETAIIWGRDDRIAPLRTGRMLVGRLPSAKMVIIDNAKHVPMNTHAPIFNQVLQQALEGSGQFSPQHNMSTSNDVSQGTLHCVQEAGTVYSGVYDSVIIERCTGITLDNVTARNAVITNSIVEFVNTDLNAENIALKINESVLVATNSSFTGGVAIQAEGSRLDLAGVSVVGSRNAVEVGKKSRFIFSVSDVTSETYVGDVHGVFGITSARLDDSLNVD